MDIFAKHEIYEIETLAYLSSGKYLEPLVFGGGTMLRLCHQLARYSVDLDFWFVKQIDERNYYKKLSSFLSDRYEVTDVQTKYFTLLFEIRSPNYPRRLKIEIRRKKQECDYQDKIAFSIHDTKQILLKAHTLEQTMKNKIEAAINRKEIRDVYDIEFMLRRGLSLPGDRVKIRKLVNVINEFHEKDYKVTLGGLIPPKMREYYRKNKFSFLLEAIQTVESGL